MELLAPGEETVEAYSEDEPTQPAEATTRPYKGSSRPPHIPRDKWQRKQYAERLKITAQEKAKTLKAAEERAASLVSQVAVNPSTSVYPPSDGDTGGEAKGNVIGGSNTSAVASLAAAPQPVIIE